jgi:hypothetical protein
MKTPHQGKEAALDIINPNWNKKLFGPVTEINIIEPRGAYTADN